MGHRVGDIVRVRDFPIRPPKGKYAVFISIAPNRFFLVNSENREMYDCISLERKGRKFPEYDCFIGCKNIFAADDSQIESKHGRLDDDELRAMLEKVGSSKAISKINKEIIAKAIATELSLRTQEAKADAQPTAPTTPTTAQAPGKSRV